MGVPKSYNLQLMSLFCPCFVKGVPVLMGVDSWSDSDVLIGFRFLFYNKAGFRYGMSVDDRIRI